MPRTVDSLKGLVLKVIAENVSYWMQEIPEDSEQYLYVISPFEVLEGELTQDVLNALVRYNTFRPNHIHLLFHPRLNTLDLSICANCGLGDGALRILFKRCKKIHQLCISGKSRFSRCIFTSIPIQYPNLRTLSLNHENVTNDFLVNIGTHCKGLLRLDIGSCSKIVDKAFKHLTNCILLEKLSLGNAEALSEATLKGLLSSCKHLKKLALPMSSIKFEFLEEGNFASNTLTSLDLTYPLSNITNTSIYRIVGSFPSLIELCLSNCEEITEKCLAAIAIHCKHLKILNISYSGIRNFNHTFEDFLRNVGQSLHSLDISGMKSVQTATVAKYCPHLYELSMNHCQSMRTEWILPELSGINFEIIQGEDGSGMSLMEACPFIKSLHIDADNTHAWGIPFDLMSVLKNAQDLRHLSLTHIPDFSDTQLVNIFGYININSIISLNISGNKGITKKGIWFVIQMLKNLRSLKINDCDVIAKEYHDLVSLLNKFKYDIDINKFIH